MKNGLVKYVAKDTTLGIEYNFYDKTSKFYQMLVKDSMKIFDYAYATMIKNFKVALKEHDYIEDIRFAKVMPSTCDIEMAGIFTEDFKNDYTYVEMFYDNVYDRLEDEFLNIISKTYKMLGYEY